jgi:hypothetical protein
MFLAAFDAGGHDGFLECRLEGLSDLADEFLLVAACALQLALQYLVAIRVQRAEAQILELELYRIQSEPFGDGRVDLQRLARDAPPFHRRHHTQRSHVVHAVGQLDHDDADVAHHCQQHFAKALRLGFLAVLELDLIEFADAVDQLGYDLAEDRSDLSLGGGRVFDDIVQNGRHQRVGIQTQVGENVRYRHRVGDVRLTREALLT